MILDFDLTQHQIDFVQSDAPFTLLSAGVGAGKSHAEAAAAIVMALANPGMAIGLGSMDYPRLVRDVFPALWMLLDSTGLEYQHRVMAREVVIYGEGGESRLQFVSLQDTTQMRGANWAGFVGDECGVWRPDIPGFSGTTWDAIRSRVRVEGGTNQIKLGTTQEGETWVSEVFIDGPEDLTLREAWARDCRVIYASSWDNPKIDHDALGRIAGGMSAGQVLEKIEGRVAVHKGQRAYHEYDRTRHCKSTEYHPLRGPIRVGIDWNISPGCATLCQLDGGRFYAFDEIVIPDNADSWLMARTIIEKCRRRGVGTDDILCYPDATGNRRDTRSGTTDLAILRKHGLAVRCGKTNPLERDRINVANGLLAHDRFQHDPRCVSLGRDFSRVLVRSDGGLDKRDPRLTHSSDGMTYLMYSEAPIRLSSIGLSILR